MSERPGTDGSRPPVAFVTHTRDYRAADVLPVLARHGFTTTERPHDSGTERMIAEFNPALVVLAIDPRQETDLGLVHEVAQRLQSVILVIGPGTGSGGFPEALRAGADVCLRDTDGVELLSAQVGALSRRLGALQMEDEGPPTLSVRDLTLDFDRCQVIRDDELVPLTPTEFKVLAFLARNAGKVVSPLEMLRSMQEYSYSDREAQEVVKVYIRRIRRKLELDPSEPDYILNVRGFGYMLERRSGKREAAAASEPDEKDPDSKTYAA